MYEGARIRLDESYNPLYINDCHVHIGRSQIKQSLDIPDMYAIKEKFNIKQLFLMSLEQDIIENNEKIIKVTHQSNDIKGLLWVSERFINRQYEQLKHIQNGIIGIKFHGTYEKKPITHPVYENILVLLEQKNGIALVHTGRYLEGSQESDTSYIHALNAAKKYKNIKFILAHLGGTDPSIIKKAAIASNGLSNVYFDTSGVTQPNCIEIPYHLIGSDKLLFGSDIPYCSFNAMYHTLLDADIPNSAKDQIFFENFERLIN